MLMLCFYTVTIIYMKQLRFTRIIFLATLLLALQWGLALPIAAQKSSGSIAQGFQADNSKGTIVAGALVSGKPGDEHSVQLADTNSASRIVGVVDSDPLVVISAATKEVQVVLSGTTNVIVSDINGPIAASDKITASPIAGVGMLATADSQVVGTAQTAFDIKNSQTQIITDSHGKQRTVHVGFLPLQIGVAFYQAPGSNFLPPFVQNIANSIAGKQVSLIRVLITSVLLFASFIGIAVLVYSSVRSALLSIGRNPLAGGDIRKSLYQVGGVALVVLGGTLLACYLILVV